MPDIIYYEIHEKKKKQADKVEKRKQEFIGLRRQERERVFDELWDIVQKYNENIPLKDLKIIIDKLKEKDFEKHRKFN